MMSVINKSGRVALSREGNAVKMTEYMITIWHNGKRWSEVVGCTSESSLYSLYKRQYNRFKITNLNRSLI